MSLNLYDVVEASVAIPESGVPEGALGTVVHVHDALTGDYIVEFFDDKKETIAVIDVKEAQVRLRR
jgi:hypothetical protein